MNKIKRWKNHAGAVLDSVNDFDVIECEDCGFKHIIPIPSPEELKKVYREEYYSVDKPLYLERHREDLDWWKLVYSLRFESFESNLPEGCRSVLDIGSGPGYFLLHGKNRGWKTIGIEPSAQAAAHSRKIGLEIIEGFFTEKVAVSLDTFDVVHVSDVLEHVPDPRGFLRLVRERLNPQGLVCIVVPNDYNPFQNILRKVCGYRPWWVAPPHHINYFDLNSLSRLLSANGFEVVLRESTFPIDMFLVMGENYVDNDQAGRRCHDLRKTFELNLAKANNTELLKTLYQQFVDIGIGREVVVIAGKRGERQYS